MRSKISFTNELRMAIALLEIPVSGWTCFNTARPMSACLSPFPCNATHPCRCTSCRSPCASSCASSSRRQRGQRPCSCSPSSSPRWIQPWQAPSTRSTRGPCRRWKRAISWSADASYLISAALHTLGAIEDDTLRRGIQLQAQASGPVNSRRRVEEGKVAVRDKSGWSTTRRDRDKY